jgi:hypothetical protein
MAITIIGILISFLFRYFSKQVSYILKLNQSKTKTNYCMIMIIYLQDNKTETEL